MVKLSILANTLCQKWLLGVRNGVDLGALITLGDGFDLVGSSTCDYLEIFAGLCLPLVSVPLLVRELSS